MAKLLSISYLQVLLIVYQYLYFEFKKSYEKYVRKVSLYGE